jgi:hypothetical protein
MAMNLRLSPEGETALESLALADGLSKNEAADRAIQEAAQRRSHAQRVEQASAEARERYADLLDRLGK